ncbi:hypothetical protein HGO34_25775 [Agrobacterium vitis]|uniref:Uncharacterized protein n=1 Tax=Agrobacterium vitis TaxID=373 RepID=A0AAE5AYY8_AGRVI|nr:MULTISPECIES: hypothetical protein [Rhizobium/Agrobacterium group]MCF1501360.1 hypothetical protein [Allorhizobium sp. Av2]MCM2443115.1 hypothetical protein [Agrobacterium vitis]MUZ60637.1 hypothetical protein [Agrobacterium vitis]MVA68333.1 hypothetical protein [Agrobacterium vitis]MVA89910.1 hypothetical protein [Agrobacterium vitis]
MERLKEWAWRCWDLVGGWVHTVDHWFDVVFYPIEKASVSVVVRAWDLRSFLIGAGGVAFGVAGLYNTYLLSQDPSYNSGLLAGLVFIQLICLALSIFGLCLQFQDNQDGPIGMRASIFAGYMGYYFKTLFAGIVSVLAGTTEQMQWLWAKSNLLFY